MQQTYQSPLPTVTPDQIDAAIAEVEYSEVGDACTTMATVTLDNGFVVTGFHSFPRAKHFVASEGRELALADARHKVSYLLQFRGMDHAMNGAHLAEATALPAAPYPVEVQLITPPTGEILTLAPVDDTLHIRITDADGNVVGLTTFDPTPDGQPADPAPAAE